MREPIDPIQACEDYNRIEQAIYYLEQHAQAQPELKDVASHIGLSEYHFQRLFTRWVGISPKRFLQFLTKENAKEMLQRSSVLDAALSSGLSSPGRLHDLMVNTEAVTPGEFKGRGAGLTIRYGFHPSPFGECLVGLTERGICYFGFVEKDKPGTLAVLRSEWRFATLVEDPASTAPAIDPLFGLGGGPISLYLVGTNFQLKVWEALLRIPPGSVTTYQSLASFIGQPNASRAVGNAVAHNPIAWLIPCHRVIRKMGEFGNYRYGPARKKAILGWEMAAT